MPSADSAPIRIDRQTAQRCRHNSASNQSDAFSLHFAALCESDELQRSALVAAQCSAVQRSAAQAVPLRRARAHVPQPPRQQRRALRTAAALPGPPTAAAPPAASTTLSLIISHTACECLIPTDRSAVWVCLFADNPAQSTVAHGIASVYNDSGWSETDRRFGLAVQPL